MIDLPSVGYMSLLSGSNHSLYLDSATIYKIKRNHESKIKQKHKSKIKRKHESKIKQKHESKIKQKHEFKIKQKLNPNSSKRNHIEIKQNCKHFPEP